MAVVQISRIQVRRGRENQGSGLPQLASGEVGWAIDTQNLYIGNGSVSEGAPQVGNTKILTENDNIFAFANQYTYLTDDSRIQTGTSANAPIQRSLQGRLDDIVFVNNFGANGDGTIQTEAIQRAIDNLYLNTNKNLPEFRYVLEFGPGVYVIDDTIKLPPYVNLHGAGPDKTIIRKTTNGPIFESVNGSSTIGSYDVTSALSTSNQPRAICVTDMSLEFDGARGSAFKLTSIRDSVFRDLRLIGGWDSTEGSLDWTEAGFYFERFSDAVTTSSNQIEGVTIEGFTSGIYADHDIERNSIITSYFRNLGYGVVFGRTINGQTGQKTGPIDNIIENNNFEIVHKQGILIENGTENFSRKNKFFDVGNDAGSDSVAVTSVIKFTPFGNNSVDDYFQRTENLSYGSTIVNKDINNSTNWTSDTVKYIPEVEGIFNYTSQTMHSINVSYTNSNFISAFRLPGNQTRSVRIDYRYVPQALAAVRTGTLEVVIDRVNDTVIINDEYDLLATDQSLFNNLEFRAKLINIGGLTAPVDVTPDTVYIEMNSTTIGDNGKLYFTISSKS